MHTNIGINGEHLHSVWESGIWVVVARQGVDTWPVPIQLLDSGPQTAPWTDTQCTCHGTSPLGGKHILHSPSGENMESPPMDFPRLPWYVFLLTDLAVTPSCVALVNVTHEYEYMRSPLLPCTVVPWQCWYKQCQSGDTDTYLRLMELLYLFCIPVKQVGGWMDR